MYISMHHRAMEAWVDAAVDPNKPPNSLLTVLRKQRLLGLPAQVGQAHLLVQMQACFSKASTDA